MNVLTRTLVMLFLAVVAGISAAAPASAAAGPSAGWSTVEADRAVSAVDSGSSVTPAALAHCPNGYMVATYGANVYSGWDSFRVIGTVRAGDVVRCYEGYDLGRRYTACGVSNGNGWVRLIANDGTRGWSPQACFADL
ncbi:hypothetical protein AB0I91_43525 [Actinosynnema sp. NPDC049800]